MSDDLRTRIIAALNKALPESASDVGFYQRLGVTPFVDIEAYDLNLELLADAVIRELPELPITITTTDQLDALPFLTVIREVRPPRRGIDYGGIYERRTSGWQCIAGTWVEPERNGPPMLPVTVLWREKDEQ